MGNQVERQMLKSRKCNRIFARGHA